MFKKQYVRYLNHRLNKDPLKTLDKYSKYLLWKNKIISYKEEYDYKMKIKSHDINKMAEKIFDFKNFATKFCGKKSA